jgi:hypothetical protein
VLTEQVSDAHLAGLRQDGVSYFFAGEHELDLGSALEILNRELGLERLLLEGGGSSPAPTTWAAPSSFAREGRPVGRPSAALPR